MGYLATRRQFYDNPDTGFTQNAKYGLTASPREDMTDPAPEMVVPQTQVVPTEKAEGVNMGQVAQAGAQGAMTGDPYSAAIGAGGSFFTQYVAQRAADERAKRAAIGQAYQNQASNEQNIINSIMATNARALR